MAGLACGCKQPVKTITTENCYGGSQASYTNKQSCYNDYTAYTPDIKDKNGNAPTINMHRSFDLSDVAINGDGKEGVFRQFHQTRIFVQGFEHMYYHNDKKRDMSTFLITANLPDQLQYAVGSKWEEPFSGFTSGIWNTIAQLGSDKTTLTKNQIASGINRLNTIKIWSGSNPFKITLNIPVLDDSHYCGCTNKYKTTNFTECLEFLGSLCLPRAVGKYGFYAPPPSALQFKFTFSEKTFILNPTRARITLQIGGMFMLDNCIVESFSVSYPNTKALIKKEANGSQARLVPLLANISITFSTIEAITAKGYSKMLWLLNQENMGSFDANLKPLVDKVTGLTGDFGTKAKSIAKSIQNGMKPILGNSSDEKTPSESDKPGGNPNGFIDWNNKFGSIIT